LFANTGHFNSALRYGAHVTKKNVFILAKETLTAKLPKTGKCGLDIQLSKKIMKTSSHKHSFQASLKAM
jgi:hypothetical protein